MGITSTLTGARSLWNTGGELGLAWADRVKYALSWYLSRPFAAAIAPSSFTLRLPGGAQAIIRPNGVDYNTLADIFMRRLYESPSNGVKHVLDLGANIGMATLFFASRFQGAQFACVEPSPDNQAILRNTIAVNNIAATVFDGVIGAEPGEADLFVGCAPDMFSLTPSPAAPGEQKLRVRQYTVSEILDSLGWDTIDLLKIDIEGYEKTLFRNNTAWLSRVRMIVGEAHEHVGYRIEGVRADLEPLGFDVSLKSFDAGNGLTIFEARRRAR